MYASLLVVTHEYLILIVRTVVCWVISVYVCVCVFGGAWYVATLYSDSTVTSYAAAISQAPRAGASSAARPVAPMRSRPSPAGAGAGSNAARNGKSAASAPTASPGGVRGE